jgi:hypothetical protein
LRRRDCGRLNHPRQEERVEGENEVKVEKGGEWRKLNGNNKKPFFSNTEKNNLALYARKLKIKAGRDKENAPTYTI